MKKVIGILALVVLVGTVGLTSAQNGGNLPAVITVENPAVVPEGIVWDAVGNRFLHGSLTQGTIYEVLDDGTFNPVIENPDFISTVGLDIDPATNRLLVVHADGSVFQGGYPTAFTATLYAYDLTTGEAIFFADFSTLHDYPTHFANDVAVDADGNAYVTDSLAPVIFKIDPAGNASILVESPVLTSILVGLNGIVYHPDGYLLAVVTTAGRLYKIPLDDPEAFSEVALDMPVYGDGMIWYGEDLAVVSLDRVVTLHSDDDWSSATMAASSVGAYEGATTLAVRDEALYVVLANLADQEAASFEIVQVELIALGQ